MKKRTQHPSVSDMVRKLSEDRAFADEFTKRLSGRQLIKVLTVLRTRAGLSQHELAEKLTCTQSKVSKLESSADAGLRFGDLMDYAGAVGYDMRIFLVPRGQRLVDEVKMHAFVIKRLLDRIVHLAGEDGAITEAVANFLEEAAFNLIGIVSKAAATLPALADEPALPLQVEASPGDEEERSRLERAQASADKSAETAALR